jgi:hypothetical protein
MKCACFCVVCDFRAAVCSPTAAGASCSRVLERTAASVLYSFLQVLILRRPLYRHLRLGPAEAGSIHLGSSGAVLRSTEPYLNKPTPENGARSLKTSLAIWQPWRQTEIGDGLRLRPALVALSYCPNDEKKVWMRKDAAAASSRFRGSPSELTRGTESIYRQAARKTRRQSSLGLAHRDICGSLIRPADPSFPPSDLPLRRAAHPAVPRPAGRAPRLTEIHLSQKKRGLRSPLR